MGLCRDNGKENGIYYNGVYRIYRVYITHWGSVRVYAAEVKGRESQDAAHPASWTSIGLGDYEVKVLGLSY